MTATASSFLRGIKSSPLHYGIALVNLIESANSVECSVLIVLLQRLTAAGNCLSLLMKDKWQR